MPLCLNIKCIGDCSTWSVQPENICELRTSEMIKKCTYGVIFSIQKSVKSIEIFFSNAILMGGNGISLCKEVLFPQFFLKMD